MLCSSCRRTLLARLASPQQSSTISLISSRTAIRTVATAPSTRNAASSTPPSSTAPRKGTPEAMSGATTGLDQPFSEPFFPSTASVHTPPASLSSPSPSAAAPIKLVSSVPGGTPLNALSYIKQPPKPLVALEDHEYPAWLWKLVADPNAPAGGATLDGGVDTSGMTKKTKAKYDRKQAKLLASLEKPIPIHEQSKDLVAPEEGAVVYAQRQKELTRSMRTARRKGIREANFLRSM